MRIYADKIVWKKNCISFVNISSTFACGAQRGTDGCVIPYKNVVAVDMNGKDITFIMIGGSQITVEFNTRPDDKTSVDALSTFMQVWQSQFEYKQDDLLNI